jgi:hypothetical protein
MLILTNVHLCYYHEALRFYDQSFKTSLENTVLKIAANNIKFYICILTGLGLCALPLVVSKLTKNSSQSNLFCVWTGLDLFK